jgi:hypothetical protein
MFEGDFRIPDGYKQPTMAEGSRYRISDIYHLQIDPEIVVNVGIMPGWRVSGCGWWTGVAGRTFF